MRSVRLLTAVAAVAGSFSLAAPAAHAQPCIPDVPGTVWFCLLTEYSSYRGVSGGLYESVAPGDYVVAGAGCYYPGGRPHYFVHVHTGITGDIATYTIPVAAPACV